MQFTIGQTVEIQLKDGRKMKGEVAATYESGIVLWEAAVTFPDGVVSIVPRVSVSLSDIVPPEGAKEPEAKEVKVEAAVGEAPAEAPRTRRRRAT
ncbi:MAG: hypothetical protein QW692_04270 [Nitrososphaerota archaeon]